MELRDLFVFDLANNHQGDIDHARRVIDGIADAVAKHGVRGALKFQFRHLDTFIHPDFRERKDVKHIPRFIETALSAEDYTALATHIRDRGLYTMSTPFDETSVGLLMNLDLDIIKIASCSAQDWPLLERVCEEDKPIVVSTAGLSMSKIDALVNFLRERKRNFAVMHCVAIYPTPADQLQLNQIALLRNRFPEVPIGWSTHEDQDATQPVQIALGMGAELFERHVGLGTEEYSLNKYSSSPEQADRWIAAYVEARAMCGSKGRMPAPLAETESLQSLQRGVYAKRDIAEGEALGRDDVFFAMPFQDGQLSSGLWRVDSKADKAYAKDAPISDALADYEPSDQQLLDQIMVQVHGLLNQARIVVGKGSGIELSHHYGLERFREFGCALIDCVNRTYCKKIIIMLPRQKHPYHFHKKKEETFQLLHGDIEVELDGERHTMEIGDTLLIKPGAWHKFHTLHGAIFEEVSTTHYNDDSFYEDERIAKRPREHRKSVIRPAAQV
ncbi:MAG: sialic acid synthase SpsE/mannose-6-phosphate isomerase-like protein (cupin superfamily) [Verrucomicrobiales bacterium]|jgi:sialic acid synthase SpsE/mannose-6-phosphate isomerase-like protein (cupin superfamily)